MCVCVACVWWRGVELAVIALNVNERTTEG